MIATNTLRSTAPVSSDLSAAPANVLPLNSPKKCLRRPVHRGEKLYRAGDTLKAIYVVHAGALKTSIVTHDGLIQVTGFHFARDTLGLDGIASGHHHTEVVALEDGEVFVLSFAQCERWLQQSAEGQRLMTRAMAHEIVHSHDLMVMLGGMRADKRIAIFLLELSERYRRLGYSRSQLMLRMTRQDIASHLGLRLETLSRRLSHMQHEGLVQVQGRMIALLDFPALWLLSGLLPNSQRWAIDPILDQDGRLLYWPDVSVSSVTATT